MIKAKTKLYGGLIVAFLSLNMSKSFSQKAIRVAVMNESMALPTGSIFKLPIHPTLNIGADFREKGGKHWKRTLGADAYFYHHRLIENAIMLDASYRIGYQFNFGLKPYFSTALGYKQGIVSGEKYELIDGQYQKANHFGKAQFNLKLGFGFEFAISDKYSLMTDYKTMAAYPSGGIFLPVSVQTFLGLGLKMNLK